MHKLVVFAAQDHEATKVVEFTAPVLVMPVMDFKVLRASADLALAAHLCKLRLSYFLPVVSLEEIFVWHRLQD
jgi:hypothetical protein